jgi:hypothetical protein
MLFSLQSTDAGKETYNMNLRTNLPVAARFTRLIVPLLVLGTIPFQAQAQLTILDKLDIARVWAGHPVDFDIETRDTFQCVAYYDTLRKMTVASRSINSRTWTRTVLPTTTGWDSHNYIEMAIDDSGYVHISGNMHNVALIYFRSRQPYSIAAFNQPGMVGSLETSVTYPVFVRGSDGRLYFQYRDGGSGSGNTIWNGYNLQTKRWSRITSQGLFNGGGSVNAYPTNPVLGPDGQFHIIWMWRDTPVANTNHHLSHIKSSDLVTWKTMAGQNLTLPITQSTAGVVADPITAGNGLINMDFWISWDSQKRAVLTYHRYDNNNISQIWNTRWENNAWKIYQTSSWTSFKWNLDLQGSLAHDIAATPLEIDAQGRLLQYYVYRDKIKRQWVLNESTLKPLSDSVWKPPAGQEEIYRVESTFDSMMVNLKKQDNYWIKWETMPINQDVARASYPSGSMLRLYTMGIQSAAAAPAHGTDASLIYARIAGTVVRIRAPGPARAALIALDGKLIRESGEISAGIISFPAPGSGCYLVMMEDLKNSRIYYRKLAIP